MIKKHLIALLFFVSAFAFSQKITLSGKVTDSIQNPMLYANVIAKPKDVTKNLKFAIPDNEGYYSLQLTKGDSINISISYLT